MRDAGAPAPPAAGARRDVAGICKRDPRSARDRPRGAHRSRRSTPSTHLCRRYRGSAWHRCSRRCGCVFGQSARPLALVGSAPVAGTRGMAWNDRLWLPDRLGEYRPRRRSYGRSGTVLCDPRADQCAAGDRARGHGALFGAPAPRGGDDSRGSCSGRHHLERVVIVP